MQNTSEIYEDKNKKYMPHNLAELTFFASIAHHELLAGKTHQNNSMRLCPHTAPGSTDLTCVRVGYYRFDNVFTSIVYFFWSFPFKPPL